MDTIRPAVPADAPALTAIARTAKAHWGYPAAWLAAWEPALTITADFVVRNFVWVAEQDGTPVGFLGLIDQGTHWDLDHLWILPEHQGRGVGRRLFDLGMAAVRERRPGTVRIEAEPQALGFYQRCGARQVGAVNAPVLGTPRELPLLEIAVNLP